MREFPNLPAQDSVLILTHMQNDFVHPDGRGARFASTFLNDGTMERIQRLLAACRAAGMPVIYHNETFRPGHPELRDMGPYVRGTGRVLGLNTHNMAVRGEWGAAVIDLLKPDFSREEYIIDNARVDPFTCTEFEVLLQGLRRRTLLIAGLACNFGVEMTARSGNERDYGICVVADCVDRLLGDYSERTLKELLPLYGRVASSAEIISELRKQ